MGSFYLTLLNRQSHINEHWVGGEGVVTRTVGVPGGGA